MRRMLVAALIALLVVMTFGSAASAAPPPDRGFPVTVHCPSGTYEAVVPPGRGEWVPAIRTNGRGVLHPVGFEGFHATLYDAETGEAVDRFDDEATDYRHNAFRHPHGFERCTWSATIYGPVDDDIPEGHYGVIGGGVLMRRAPR